MLQGSGRGRSVLDVCFGLLVAAVLLYVAVQILRSIFIPLVVIGGILLAIALVVRMLQWRYRGW
jgi:multisubunit Na+/H+ antiporter MnhE subunit